jgi:hypothetical protein
MRVHLFKSAHTAKPDATGPMLLVLEGWEQVIPEHPLGWQWQQLSSSPLADLRVPETRSDAARDALLAAGYYIFTPAVAET